VQGKTLRFLCARLIWGGFVVEVDIRGYNSIVDSREIEIGQGQGQERRKER